MITLSVTEEQANMIRYALGELASRRQEQAIDMLDTPQNKQHRAATYAESERLRALQRQVADRIKSSYGECQTTEKV